MKKLILIAIAFLTIQASAQEKKRTHQQSTNHKKEMYKDLTPEEIAQLQTKKMTLHLDLTEAQQKQILTLNIEQAKQRKAKMDERQKMKEKKKEETLSKEERLKMMNEKLDHQIELKKKMKGILDVNQFEKWEKLQEKRKTKNVKKQQMKKRYKKQ